MSTIDLDVRNRSECEPRVWLLTGNKAGDRAQLITLAEALGWPFCEKRLSFNQHYKKSNIRLGASLRSLDPAAAELLRPPWPDLILASGRRVVPIARWIKKQANGRVRLVHVGRPWAPLMLFDLIISTAQYQLPARANVITNKLTLNRHDADSLATAAAAWTPIFRDYPRPLIGVLVGGSVKPFVFDCETAVALGRAARSLAASLGGTLLVTTSPRTRSAAIDALFAELPATAFLHRFDPQRENPYLGIIALADRFIVTGDSASMLTEACASGKPVHLFRLPDHAKAKMRMLRTARRLCLGLKGHRGGFLARGYYALLSSGVFARSMRDMRLFHETLVASQWVMPWEDLSSESTALPGDELREAVERIHALFDNARLGMHSSDLIPTAAEHSSSDS